MQALIDQVRAFFKEKELPYEWNVTREGKVEADVPGGDSGSSFGLHEAMMAARDLEDTLFPDLHIEQEFLKLAKEA